jgi:xanthine/uracil permease
MKINFQKEKWIMKKLLFATLCVVAFFMYGGAVLIPYVIPVGVGLAIIMLAYDIFFKGKFKKDKRA